VAKAKRKAATKAKSKKSTPKKTKRPAKKKSSSNEMLVVQSKFKDALKAHGMNVAGDASEGFNQMLHWYVGQAASRAQANGRKTVRAHDFMVN